jgi:hypothetical protein
LDLLDEICNPYRGCDAEFEAEDTQRPGHIHPDYTFYTDPEGPLGRLMVEAFAPNGINDLLLCLPRNSDGENEYFTKHVYNEFHKRYKFC